MRINIVPSFFSILVMFFIIGTRNYNQAPGIENKRGTSIFNRCKVYSKISFRTIIDQISKASI